jgi:rare lipoprotein A
LNASCYRVVKNPQIIGSISLTPPLLPHNIPGISKTKYPIRINQGVPMVFRLSAICGAVITLAVPSAAMARSEIGAVHSTAVDNAASGAAIVGAASMYNPFRPGYREGGANTASGERYDPSAWAAAIKTNLRKKFGGVHNGARPKYALIEGAGKKAIIKINDVGPLTPGRIVDFNEKTMRYFDPSLRLGVIGGVKVTPLSGDDWTPGPIAQK